jgi:hypothetical protein
VITTARHILLYESVDNVSLYFLMIQFNIIKTIYFYLYVFLIFSWYTALIFKLIALIDEG